MAALVAALLTVPLLGVTGAVAAPRDLTGPDLPQPTAVTDAEQAARALDRAERLLAEKRPAAARRQATSRPDATLALRDVVAAYDDLSPHDQEVADRLLARPTPDGDDIDGTLVVYSNGEATPVCGPVVCVHYANGPDSDAPGPEDSTPANGVPDAVDRTLEIAEDVNATYTAAGYRRPDADGALGGSSGKVDVYLADLGGLGLYGYCTTDQDDTSAPYNRWAYCVVDDDFAAGQFPSNTPLENLQVTLAHEYFHAVQFAYDYFEDGWVMEATATWAEEQLFDGVDDNRQYVRSGQVGRPYVPLDYFGESAHYGNWVFFQYLTERWRGRTGGMPTLVLDLWKRLSGRAGAPDDYSTQAVQNVLAARRSSFTRAYGQFTAAMRQPTRALSEGRAAAYAPAAPAATRTLSPRKRSTPRWAANLDHLTNLTARIKPSRALRSSDWRLRVQVDLPPGATAPVAHVVTQLKSGRVTTKALKFRKRGWSSTTVGFSAGKVRHAEVVVANASRRTTCWVSGTSPFACLGAPRDDGARFQIVGSVFRR